MAFKLPETLDGLNAAELGTLIDAALDDFRALNLTEDSSDEDIESGEKLHEALNALRAKRTEVEAAAAEKAADRAERLANLADADPAPAEEPAVETAPEPVEEPAVEAAPEPAVEVEEPAVEAAPEPELVTAAAEPAPQPTRSPVQRAAAAAPEVHVPDSRSISLVAAADVPGYSNGQELDDLSVVTSAVLARTRGLPKTNLATAAGGVRQRYGAALIRKQGFGDLVQSPQQSDDYGLVWRTGDESRLEGGSLVAAGGWCAPSETLYDLCQYETLEGILDIPEFQVNRGGIRWTPGPSFDDIYAACGFEQTEAEAIAGDCKDCCSVDCPAFAEIRLDAIGLCVKSPILTEAAYPELTRRFIEGAMVAHQHKVNQYIIDTILLSAGTPSMVADAGAITVTLSSIEWAAVGMRYQYRMSETQTIEVIAPMWLKTAVRQDLALEAGRDSRNVSDAEVNGWFTSRNLSVQWVYDYQDLDTSEDCVVTIPPTATVLMYPAGTWAKGTSDVINMDAVYDSPNLEANQYTALFMEEGILAVQRCTHTCAITVPVCISGKRAIDNIDLCLAGVTGGVLLASDTEVVDTEAIDLS